MNPPPFPTVTQEHLHAIAERHDIEADTFLLLPQVGIFNKIYQIGENFILRIGREHPKSFMVAQVEATAVPLARMAGVRTPELLVMDDSCEILPSPYTIYERVKGDTLGLLNLDPGETPDTWREVGRDLALLHHVADPDDFDETLGFAYVGDPRQRPDELAQAGYFTPVEARWFSGLLARLAPVAWDVDIPKRLTHGDVQSTNIMIDANSRGYLALIDWGSACLRDPAFDIAGMPLRAAPYLLEGYREIGPLLHDETAEARILWRHLELALGNLRGEPEPELSWAERPMTHFIEVMRFLIENEDERWQF